MSVNLCIVCSLSLQFYLEEAKGRVDYQGYIFPRRRGQTVSDLILFFRLDAEKSEEKKT